MTKQKSCMHLTVWRNCLWVWEKKGKKWFKGRGGEKSRVLSERHHLSCFKWSIISTEWFQYVCIYQFALWMSLNIFFFYFCNLPKGKRVLHWLQLRKTLEHSKFASGLEKLCHFELIDLVWGFHRCWWMLHSGLGFALLRLAPHSAPHPILSLGAPHFSSALGEGEFVAVNLQCRGPEMF